MSHNSQHIEASLEKIRAIFIKASERIEAIQEETLPATKLAEELAAEFDTVGSNLYPVIKYLIKGYPGFEVLKGARGGLKRLKVKQ